MYTLADQAQAMPDSYEKGVIKACYEYDEGGMNNLLKVMPVGSVKRLTTYFLEEEDEGSSSSVGSREINGAYPEGTATLTERGFTVGNLGTRVGIDEIFEIQEGYHDTVDPEAQQLRAASRRLTRAFNNGIINGDRATAPNFFNGLKRWVVSDNILTTNSLFSQANGITISTSSTTQRQWLEALDYGIEQVGGYEGDGKTYIIMNNQAKRQTRKAVRELGWFGTNGAYYDSRVDSYGGIPFLNPGSKNPVRTLTAAQNNTNSVIPNNFTFGSSLVTTEVWIVKLSLDDGLGFYQLRPLKVRDIGLLEAAPVHAWEIDWWGGIFPKTDKCVAKISGFIAA